MGGLRLDGFGQRVPGPKTHYNEDDFRVEPAHDLAMVSAGMGSWGQGRPSGKLAIWSVLGEFERAGATASPSERMHAGLARADEAISRLFPGGDLAPPGAMFAGVYLDGSRVVLAHVGGARIYQVRGGSLVSVTEDHTLARDLAARGVQSEPSHTFFITRLLGFRTHGGPTLREVEARAGDRFVLCTRHVHARLEERTIIEAAGQGGIQSGCETVVQRFCDHPARDPYQVATVVVAEVVRGDPQHPAHGGSRRPAQSWLFNPGAPLPDPPGEWPQPDEAWFRDVYAVVMGEDG